MLAFTCGSQPSVSLDPQAFNKRVSAARGNPWTEHPVSVALMFIRDSTGGTDRWLSYSGLRVELISPAERFNQATLTITQSGYMDDAIAGERFQFDMEREGELWKIRRASKKWSCYRRWGSYGTLPCR